MCYALSSMIISTSLTTFLGLIWIFFPFFQCHRIIAKQSKLNFDVSRAHLVSRHLFRIIHMTINLISLYTVVKYEVSSVNNVLQAIIFIKNESSFTKIIQNFIFVQHLQILIFNIKKCKLKIRENLLVFFYRI